MSLLGVVESFATSSGEGAGEYTLTRRAAATYVNGRKVAGAATDSTIIASVQPLTGRALDALPEGRNAGDARIVYTESEIRVEDRVEVGGEAFEVYRVDGPWELDGGIHYEAHAARQVIP